MKQGCTVQYWMLELGTKIPLDWQMFMTKLRMVVYQSEVDPEYAEGRMF